MADIRIEEKKARAPWLLILLLLIVAAIIGWWLWSNRYQRRNGDANTQRRRYRHHRRSTHTVGTQPQPHLSFTLQDPTPEMQICTETLTQTRPISA